MAPSFVKFCQVYHAFARAHTTVYLGPILLLHEYTLHSYTTKYTLHYVYSNPALYTPFFNTLDLRLVQPYRYSCTAVHCTAVQRDLDFG